MFSGVENEHVPLIHFGLSRMGMLGGFRCLALSTMSAAKSNGPKVCDVSQKLSGTFFRLGRSARQAAHPSLRKKPAILPDAQILWGGD